MSYYDPDRNMWLVEKRLHEKYMRFLNRELNYNKNSHDKTEKNIRGWFRQNYGTSSTIVREVIFSDYNHFRDMNTDKFGGPIDRYYDIKLMQFLRYRMAELELFFL